MKLSYWGKFVNDNDPFAEYEIEGGPSKLIITLVNVLNMLDGEVCNQSRWTRWEKVDFIEAMADYFNYNVHNFDDFTITNKLVDIGCGNIKMPINIFKSLDEDCKYRMVVVGEPGELHYLLKENMTLSDCIRYDQGLVSFSIKTGEELMFMKNYINAEDYIREEYIPGGGITTRLYKIGWCLKYRNLANKNVCAHSAFADPDCLDRYFIDETIYVNEKEQGVYEINTVDCDGRPRNNEIREGDSLYSVYYQYMVDKGYFDDKSKQKVK